MINSVSSAVSSYSATTTTQKSSKAAANTKTTDDTAVVYEKSSAVSNDATYSSKVKNADLVAALKKDSEDRVNSLINMVRETIAGQGQTLASADDVWKFLASGNFTVSEAAKAEAQAAISDDGYWGVDKTSERILEFAKAVSGGDSSKAQTLLDAFKKGYSEATKSWGKTLPDISSKTYDAVVKGFEDWMDESSDTVTE